MTLEEQLCRTICKAENVDPDQVATGIGNLMPLGQQYPLWKARLRVAKAILNEYYVSKEWPQHF